jgi:Coenzyme PQQ synthesis protein D (PqqD)
MREALEQRLIRPGADVVSCELGGETVILDMASGRYFALDPVGTTIWEWIQQPCTFAALCERLVGEYDVDHAACRQDVSRLLDQLVENGLIQLDEAL